MVNFKQLTVDNVGGWASSNQVKAFRAKTEVSQEEEILPPDCSISSCLSFHSLLGPALQILDLPALATAWANSLK